MMAVGIQVAQTSVCDSFGTHASGVLFILSVNSTPEACVPMRQTQTEVCATHWRMLGGAASKSFFARA